MVKKLNIRELLKGTPYEARADYLARKIEGWGLDNNYSIHELPKHGMIDGINPNLLIQTILEQEAKQIDEPEEEFQEEPEEETERETEGEFEPDWLKATSAALDLAEEHNIDLSVIDGTGKAGTIVKSDVEKFLEEDEHDD